MSERSRFWKKIRDEHYTILCPDMLPVHFELFSHVLAKHGYHLKVVTPIDRTAKDEGLRYVHNDACYPALIVTGQFMKELKSGAYDLSKTAVIISQTGGGCRASNYLSLIKKALAKEFPQVPVLSLNFSGLEKTHALPITLSLAREMFAATLYGDMLMDLYNETRPYQGTEKLADKTKQRVINQLSNEVGHHSFLNLKKNYAYLINEFSKCPLPEKRKPRVAIVGEIFVKYSSYANNGLEDYLLSEGVEPVLPSLSEFLLYCLYNMINDHRLYGLNAGTVGIDKIFYHYLLSKTREARRSLKNTRFQPYEDFESVQKEGTKIINLGVKMGEGWLIPSEMLSYAEHGVKNIVCVQPFGCLPNHIVGKGMIRPLKKLCPDVNVAALDFDASSTRVNQENRLRLMLANIQR